MRLCFELRVLPYCSVVWTQIGPLSHFSAWWNICYPCTLCQGFQLSCCSAKWVTVIWKKILRSLDAHRHAGGGSASDDFRLSSLCCSFPRRLHKKRKWVRVCVDITPVCTHTQTHTHFTGNIIICLKMKNVLGTVRCWCMNVVCVCVYLCVSVRALYLLAVLLRTVYLP